MSSTGSKAVQFVALVAGVALLALGVRQCSASDTDETTTVGTPVATGADATSTTTPTTAAPGGADGPVTTAPRTTSTVVRTTTTLMTLPGSFEIVPADTTFTANYPYPADPANPNVTPRVNWDLAIGPGQRVEIRGPGPGTPETTLSPVRQGTFVPCPGGLVGTECRSEPGSYTFTALVLEGDTVVARRSISLQLVAGSSGGGGEPGGGGEAT